MNPDLLRGLEDVGLNVSGVAAGDGYERYLQGCRSVVVVGSGGPALWEALVAASRREPTRWTGEQHPLDAFVVATVNALDPEPGPSRRWVFCGALEADQPDFRTLAYEAGLGHRSRLGLLLHPVYGPWLGLRAACFTTEALEPTGPLPGGGPCEGCPAPCASACPGGAFAKTGDWDVGRCASFHEESTRCHRDCASRSACPVGAVHVYGELEQLYHNNRVLGRPAVAAMLGVVGDREGVGPHWARWSSG